jgi:TnpA family transposase
MPRLQILTPEEAAVFETPPVFSALERERFFQIPESFAPHVASQRTLTNQVYLVLSLGYFRATNRFFPPHFRPADSEHVVQRLGYLPGLVELDRYDEKATTARQRQVILEYLGFRPFDAQARQDLTRELRTMIRSQQRPKVILLHAVDLLSRRKIEVPNLFTLTSLIAKEMARHRQVVAATLDTHLTAAHRTLLDALLVRTEAEDAPDSLGPRFPLTLFKRFSHSTRPSRIKANCGELRILRPLYQTLAPAITALDLTPEGLRYYATSVLKARIHQVTRRATDDRHLYLVCFLAHQFLRLHDILIDSFLLAVQHVRNVCQRDHKERYYQARLTQRRTLRTVVTAVDHGWGTPLATIETLAFDPQLAAVDKVGQIQAVFMEGRAARAEAEGSLQQLKAQVAEGVEDADYYEVLTAQSLRLQNRVADIMKEVNFQGDETTALMVALRHYQAKGGVISQGAPLDSLPPAEQRLVHDEHGKLQVSLYKVLLFLQVTDALKAGAINLPHSYKYRSLEDYLLPKAAWTAHRQDYLRRADLLAVADCQQTLRTFAERLDQQYHHTNHRIAQGENPHFHPHKDGSFHIATPAEEEEESDALRTLLPAERYIPLGEVLSTVNRLTHFLDAFVPWQAKYARAKPPEKTFLAGLIGYGCFIGIGKIARISKGMRAAELETTVNRYFTLENLYAANDRILAFMDHLELPNVYRRQPGQLHTSSDGAKFSVAVESLNANYSFKYLGKDLGVSVYTFLDERHFFWHHAVISAAEREAAYVIDGLLHNEVVKSDIHSTDTHGYSEVIFGALHLLGFAFAPRLANLKHRQLYAFRRRRDYERLGYALVPDLPLRLSLIVPQWEEILRFIATIKLKETTASQLFRRLNSYSQQHPLYLALKEFGKIPKSEFLLRFVDNLALRQTVEKQLNKGENGHQFSRAVGFGHNQEFLHGEKIEQEIAEGCRRLIKNAIVCWNYVYLTQQILAEPDAARRQAMLTIVQNGSVSSWRHVNLHGEYDFSDDRLQDSVGLVWPLPGSLFDSTSRPPNSSPRSS